MFVGSVLWNHDYGAPVVALYSMEQEGLQRVPFFSMAAETLHHLTGRLASEEWATRFLAQGKDEGTKQVF